MNAPRTLVELTPATQWVAWRNEDRDGKPTKVPYAAPDRRLVFDVNDFDETLPAPFEWDVKRLAASFAVAARDHGFTDRDARTAARLTVRSYRTKMAGYAAMRFVDVWYSRFSAGRPASELAARPASTTTYASCAT